MSRFIIDVREPEEYADGHVENSLNIPLSYLMNSTKMLAGIPTDSEVILYCTSGNRSSKAKNILEEKGYVNVINGINQESVRSNYASN